MSSIAYNHPPLAADQTLLTPKARLSMPKLWTLGMAAASRRYERAVRQLERSQLYRLKCLLRAQADTAYGAAHGFAELNSLVAYQTRVPLVDYETLQPWLNQIVAGGSQVLTRQRVLGMRPSAGQGGAAKLLPVTAGLHDEMAAAWRPFIYDCLKHHPKLAQQSLYWEKLPSHGPQGVIGALPIFDRASFSLDAAVGGFAQSALQNRSAVQLEPEDLASGSRWRQQTLLGLLLAEDLVGLLLGNPSHALQLIEALHADLPALLPQLPPGRAYQIRRVLQRDGRLLASALWPQLACVTLWRDGAMAPLAAQVASFFRGIPLGTSPLGSAEAMLTVPLQRLPGALGAPLAATSHFFEFIDLDKPRQAPLLAHALRAGAVYQPVVSTAGGLYRYRLDDAVRCTGRYHDAPTLQFVDKTAPGGHLTDGHVDAARLQRAIQQHASNLAMELRFVVGAPPEATSEGYTLYVDTDASDAALLALAQGIEASLCASHAYWSGRQMGHMAPLEVVRVQHGWQRYRQACQSGGAASSTLQPSSLDARRVARQIFAPQKISSVA